VEARRDDRSFAGRRDGRRGVGEGTFSGRDSRALESVHRRAYHVGAREALHRRRVWRRARGALATRCGGRTRANARLARWRHVSSFGRMVENGRATRRNFFFFRSSKNTIVEKPSQKQRFVLLSPTPSRRELQTSRLGVHGVALPAAEPHAAPRAVVARLEPAHRAELPRRGRAGGSSRRRRVRRHLRRNAIEPRPGRRRNSLRPFCFASRRAWSGQPCLFSVSEPSRRLRELSRACRSEIERCVVREL
jgi:hypothetical protein